MKKLFIFALTVMLLANTTIVSAWAKPCPHNTDTPSMSGGMNAQDGLSPCHQKDDKKRSDNKNQSCEELCLFAQVSNSLGLLTRTNDGIYLPVIIKQPFIIVKDTLASISQIPRKRPPKHIS
tara:strand:- start:1149 stop:1514 length:366 start_codon:yes stop_codon:yes gene_type:complete